MDRGNSLLRWLDSTVGPIILVIIGLFRKKGSFSQDPRRIGLIKSAALGDTVLVSAILSDLRAAYPNAEIVLIVGRGNSGLARLLSGLNRVLVLPLRRPWTAVALLREQRLDWIIDCDSWPRISACWAALSGSHWTIGFKTLRQRRHYAFDQIVEHRDDVHELENYRNLIRALGVEVGAPPQSFPQAQTKNSNSRLIVLHLWPGGTKSHLREWPLASWRELVIRLSQIFEAEFVLTGGNEDRERTDLFLKSLPEEIRVRSYVGKSLAETIQLLKECGLLVSVNTGIMHLADAVGTPLVALHGPTNPKRWGPLRSGQISILPRDPRAGHLNLGFEYDSNESLMPLIPVVEVERAVIQLMHQISSAQR